MEEKMENCRPLKWINFGEQPDIRFSDRTSYPFGPFCRDMEGSRFEFEVWNVTGVIGDRVVELMQPGADLMFYIYPETMQMALIPFLTDGSRYAWVIIEDEGLFIEDKAAQLGR